MSKKLKAVEIIDIKQVGTKQWEIIYALNGARHIEVREAETLDNAIQWFVWSADIFHKVVIDSPFFRRWQGDHPLTKKLFLKTAQKLTIRREELKAIQEREPKDGQMVFRF